LGNWDYASPGWYFVTICTRGRIPYFGRMVDRRVQLSEIGSIAHCALQELSGYYHSIRLDCWIVMPNHVHSIIVIDGDHEFSPGLKHCSSPSCKTVFPRCAPAPKSLAAVVRSYKAGVARSCGRAGLEFAWQPRYYEHVLQSDLSINAVREYIISNPQNWSEDPDNICPAVITQ